MSRSLIRKNQLHPDIADLVSGYGTGFFITEEDLELALSNFNPTSIFTGSNVVFITGDQTISGLKIFTTRPQVNGSGVLLQGELNINNNLQNVVYTTGDQTISGSKNFTSVPTVNGIPLSTGSSDGTSEYVFPSNLSVSLSSGKTFGRYRNGDTILSSGKTTSEVLRLALVEPITPTVLLNISSPSSIPFNQTIINNTLNASTTINSLDASVQTGFLEWRRGNIGPWVQLTGNTLTGFSFVHTLIDDSFNTSGFNYRYIVIDTAGASGTGITSITPQSYSAPTLTITSVGNTPALLGSAKNTTLSARINKISNQVPLISYQLQYSTGTPTNWINIGGIVGILGDPNSHTFTTPHIDNNLVNATGINYRVIISDSYTGTNRSLGSRTFLYERYLGYNTGEFLTGMNQIEALISGGLSDLRTGFFPKVTTPSFQHFTYYAYRSGAGPITSVVQNGATTIYTNTQGGAFIEQNGISGLNKSGANVFYRVYRSSAPGAFTEDDLEFR